MMNLKSIKEWIQRKWGRRKKPADKVLLTISPDITPTDELRSPEPEQVVKPFSTPEADIDFRHTDDLEAYAENLNVPVETIETWISAGLLYPDEIRIAEKMIQILRKKEESRN